MEYQVPQFIEVEDKIFGPLTFRQFIYLAGGAGLCAIVLVYLPFILGIILALPLAALAGALAFYKMNGKPFISVIESAFNYFTGSKLYKWKKNANVPEAVQTTPASTAAARVEALKKSTPLTRSKLRDLAWSLDVKNRVEKEPS